MERIFVQYSLLAYLGCGAEGQDPREWLSVCTIETCPKTSNAALFLTVIN